MTERKQTCVVVLGMHRSGTSLLAGVLSILGVDFGNKLLPPREFNPKGFFEHVNILNANIDLLKHLGVDREGWLSELRDDWHQDSEIINFKNKIKKIIQEDFSESDIFGFKDPRISILLPIYVEILEELGIRAVFAIADRQDFEVALSLEKRANLSLIQGLRSTAYFKRNIEVYLKDQVSVKVNFDQLINDPVYTVEKTIQKLGIPVSLNDRNLGLLKEFIDPGLKHHTVTSNDFILELAERLEFEEKNTKEEEGESLHEILNDKKTSIQNIGKGIDKLLLRTVNEHEKDRMWWQDKLNSFESSLEEKDTAIQRLNDRLLKKEGDINDRIREKDSVEEKLNVYKNKYMDLEDTISSLNFDINKMGSHTNHLQDLINQRDSQIESLNATLTSIERSFTWKLTKAWNMLITLIMPKGSFLHNKYRRVIAWNQNILNDWLPGKIVKEIKKKEKRIDAGYFWEKFKKENTKGTDILFINHCESRTGAPRIVFDVAEDTLGKKEIAIVSLKKGSMGEDFEETFGSVIYPDDLYPSKNEEEQVRIILEQVKPKVVYANSISTFRYAEAARELGIKVIFHVHELDIAFQIFFSPKQRKEFKNFADKFIAVSQPVYDLLVHKLECDPEKVELINAFVSREKIIDWSKQIDSSFVDEEIKKEEGEIVIMCVGMFIYRKGADMFMQMAERLKNRGHKCRFVWIGSKPFKEPFMADFNKYKEHFLLLGEKTNPFPYLAASDIFICPSREDPFPLVVLESMALGKPTIVFKDAGGIPKAVKDAGEIVDEMTVDAFSNALERVIVNKSYRHKLASKAVENQSIYDSKMILPKIEHVIENLLQTKE